MSVDSELCDEGEFTHTKSMTKIAMEGSERASQRLARRVPQGAMSPFNYKSIKGWVNGRGEFGVEIGVGREHMG